MRRKFSQEESAAILHRAIELHSAQNAEVGSSDQSLADLQKAASELGIAPSLVAQAVSELVADHHRPSRLDRFIGGPHHIEFEQHLEGRITEDSWPAIIDAIRRATGRIGNPGQSGSMFEWTSSEPDGIHVSFVPDGNGTRVRVVTAIGGWAGLLFFVPPILALFISGIVGAINHLGPAPESALIVCSLTATYLFARRLFSRISDRRQKMMNTLSHSLPGAFEEDRDGLSTRLMTSSQIPEQGDSGVVLPLD